MDELRGERYQKVADGWGQYVSAFSAGVSFGSSPVALLGPIIYTVDQSGKLDWRAHIRMDANDLGRNCSSPKPQPQDWPRFKQVIAIIPGTDSPGSDIH